MYVVDATTSAFSLFLRYLDEVVHTVTKSLTATDWTDATNTISQLASTEILLSADIQVTTVWNGSLWIENTDASPATFNREFSTDFTVDIGAEVSLPWTLTYTAAPVTLAAFDGNLNYFGSSAHQLNGLVLSKVQNQTVDSGAALSQFVGTGTVLVSLAADGTFTKSGGVSSSTANTSTASVVLSVTYHYYAGPTADIVTQPQPTSTLSRVTPSVDILDGTTPAPRATRLVPELFTCFVKPPDYVPTARAAVASGFKPALVCAVRERVTPQPRPPYLPPPPEPPTPTPENFVWGDSWSWTSPLVEGAVYYVSTGFPTGIAATGFFDNNFAGVPYAILGDTPVSIQGYDELIETPVGDPVEYPDLTTSCRLYYGELDSLPDPETAFDIGALGLTERLSVKPRNEHITVAASPGVPRYVVIGVPQATYGGASTGYNFNEILTDAGADSGLDGFAGYPFSGADPVGGTAGTLPYFLFVLGPTEAAVDVYLRFVATTTYTKIGPSPASSDMSYSSSIPQLDPGSATMFKVNVQATAIYGGSSWVENTDASSHSITRSVVVDYTMSVGTIDTARQTTNNIAAITFAAYDGDPDYLGASGHQSTPAGKNSGTSNTDYTDAPTLAQFAGTGTLPVEFSAVTTHTVTGSPSVLKLNPQTLVGQLVITYHYYAL